MTKEKLIERIREAVESVCRPLLFDKVEPAMLARLSEQVRQGIVETYSDAGAKRMPVVIPKVIDSEEDRKAGRMRFTLEYRHPDTNEPMTEDEVKRLMNLDEFVALTLGLTPSVEEGPGEPSE